MFLLFFLLPFTLLGLSFCRLKSHILIISLIGSILNLIQILILMENLDLMISRFQYLTFFGLFGIDGLSIWLIWLIGILLPIILLNVAYNKINKMKMI